MYKSATQQKLIRIAEAGYIITYIIEEIASAHVTALCLMWTLRASQENPPDRNRGEQLKTQAVNRLVEVIQKDGI